VRGFRGKTTKGIGMGSTLQEIETAYGAADGKHEDRDGNETSLYYEAFCMLLRLKEGRLCDLSIHLGDRPDT